jgi:protein kinase A
MPTLGGFLKKKRTKEGSKDQSSETSSPITPVTSKTLFDQSAGFTPATSPQANGPMPSQNQPPTQPTINNLVNAPQGDGQVQDGAEKQPSTARQTKGKYNLVDFNFQRTLGTGSFGRVHLVQSKHNQRFYAVKVLKKQQVVKMKQVEHTNDERRMLGRVKQPFCITLWGTFQDSKNLYMVMDFVEGGELFSLLRKSQVCLMYCPGLISTNAPDSASQIPLLSSTPPKLPSPSNTFTIKISSIAT